MANDKANKHAVVIGAGFGGLAAAIRLSVQGYDITVVDRLEQPGGRARVFRQDGYVFDAGPTVITAPFLFDELWEMCGKKRPEHVEFRPVDPFYRIRFDDGDVFDYCGDHARMCEQIQKLCPEDVEGYKAFLAHSERIFKIGFEQLAHVPFNDAMAMAKIVPDMVALESYRSVVGLVEKYIKHDKLRQVLSFHPLLVGGNPYNTTSIYTLIAFLERKWGVHFAMGGTGSLVTGLVDLIEERGGVMRLGAEVDQIQCEHGRATGVRLTSGEIIPADVVVSNADALFTYKHLVPASERKTWNDRRVHFTRSSMGLFVWYFGTDRKYDDIAHHTILLGPRYKGLLDDIFHNKTLAEDFSLYLHRPTATDPSLAPEGCDGFYVLSPVPHMDSGIDWDRQSERYRQAIEDHLADTIMPDLGKHIASSRVLHPRNFAEDYLAFRGSAFSVEPILPQSAYFRPHNKSEDVDRLFLVGAGTHPGAGVPGVLSTARVLDGIVPTPAHLDTPQTDLAYCHEILKRGSKSFHAAGRLLPPSLKDEAAPIYAFCRLMDDAIDSDEGRLDEIRERVRGLYAAVPSHPVDRAVAKVVADKHIPEEILLALVEGFAWDAEGRTYATMSELHDYCVRVASTVGVMMTLMMGERRPDVLARACDLGVAMQLTNIARDVGEDARNGRIYLPTNWFDELGVDRSEWIQSPRHSRPIGDMVQRLLEAAQILYQRAEPGIAQLPKEARVAIMAAREIYEAIGDEIAQNGYDSVNQRAFTSRTKKLGLAARSLRALLPSRKTNVDQPPLDSARFLVEAVSHHATRSSHQAARSEEVQSHRQHL
jgi:phytoene desaturase